MIPRQTFLLMLDQFGLSSGREEHVSLSGTLDFHEPVRHIIYGTALVLFVLSAARPSSGQDANTTYSTPDAAQADADFAIQGEYVPSPGATTNKAVQVVALGKGTFRAVIYTGGLPGAGWNKQPPQILEEEETEVIEDLIRSLQLIKVDRASPTLGKSAPQGAVVLFDGTEKSLKENWKAGAKITPDGLLIAGATSLEPFRDYSLHLEFRTPFMPLARGQARGNSGVYHQSRYETQILDSFGLDGRDNEAGGIYTIRAPDQNMCFPPLTWQTYDVDFSAARFDTTGKKISDAKLTVQLNGVVIQRDVAVNAATRAAPLTETPEPGPIYLQDHGNPVHFRNIWLVPRDADRAALRPRIPGYERFFELADASLSGGKLLAGELGCIQCHTASDAIKKDLLLKQAPILTEVGSRVRPEWIAQFLQDPHGVKPGTTMPDLLQGRSPEERAEAAQALTHFLSTTGLLRESNPDDRKAAAGEKLFDTVGCVACHAPTEPGNVPVATSVPLADLPEKYTIHSLSLFLKDPHAVRPSARMPSLSLDNTQAEQVAHFLLRKGGNVLAPNVHYKVYEGRWLELPNFDELTPVKEGLCVGFDLSVAGKKDNFGIRFEAFLPDQMRGAYVFSLGSDDGARLSLDGEVVLETPGIHPVQEKTRTARFEDQPMHTIRVDYFEATGEEDLIVMLGRQGQPLEYLAPLLVPTADAAPAATTATDKKARFKADPQLVQHGRELFVSIGCANCHELKENDQLLKSTLSAPALASLKSEAGCLSSNPPLATTPRYALTSHQTANLTLLIDGQKSITAVDAEERMQRTLIAFNCVACHERGGLGGPEASRNSLFHSSQPEMGDEGRLPPPLNGVGDKLQDGWLKNVLNKGAKSRPYMLTRMPAFGEKNVGHLISAFAKADRKDESHLAKFDEPLLRVKSTGRELVGNGGLACIKCHTFGDKKASGIQAVSLTDMSGRIREDWFLRYLVDPQKYRPGTRMPTGFPNGEASIKDVYHGNTNQQVSAIWMYLSDGNKAGIPDGLVAQMIELKPDREPIIYRNFIQGLSPRAIAVGYPEKVNLAWDADELCLKLIWHDRFLDASMHWTGRGTGSQTPMGDHILSLDSHIPLAVLESRDQAWPTESLKQTGGYRFKGYQLDERGRPAFRYHTPFADVIDDPQPIPRNHREGTLRRVMTIRPVSGAGAIYFLAGTGNVIQQNGDVYQIDDSLRIRISGGEPFVRKIGEKKELLVPVVFKNGEPTVLTQEIDW